MKMTNGLVACSAALMTVLSLGIGPAGASAQQSTPWQQQVLDNCKTEDNTATIGTIWTASLDSERGGTSTIEWTSTKGTFAADGVVEPVPGSMGPGTAGMLLPLSMEGTEFDLTGWDGISITIKRTGAPLLLRVHSSEIENGDHFATMIPDNGRLETYRYSFRQLGQVMSAQQPWSGQRVTGIELIAFGWNSSEFSWEISELALYRDDTAEATDGEDKS